MTTITGEHMLNAREEEVQILVARNDPLYFNIQERTRIGGYEKKG